MCIRSRSRFIWRWRCRKIKTSKTKKIEICRFLDFCRMCRSSQVILPVYDLWRQCDSMLTPNELQNDNFYLSRYKRASKAKYHKLTTLQKVSVLIRWMLVTIVGGSFCWWQVWKLFYRWQSVLSWMNSKWKKCLSTMNHEKTLYFMMSEKGSFFSNFRRIKRAGSPGPPGSWPGRSHKAQWTGYRVEFGPSVN